MNKARGLMALLSLVSLTIGFGLERLSLALIVPGVFVLACLVITHGRDQQETKE